jgi:hypothetical protein
VDALPGEAAKRRMSGASRAPARGRESGAARRSEVSGMRKERMSRRKAAASGIMKRLRYWREEPDKPWASPVFWMRSRISKTSFSEPLARK